MSSHSRYSNTSSIVNFSFSTCSYVCRVDITSLHNVHAVNKEPSRAPTNLVLLVYRNGKAPQIPPAETGTPSMGTFLSDSPDSPMEFGTSGTFYTGSRDSAFPNLVHDRGPPASKRAPSSAAALDAEIAPWLSSGPSESNGGLDGGSSFDDVHAKPQTNRPDNQQNELVDPMFYTNDRRPSMASATTVSSQNSMPISRASTSRGNHSKRLGAYFGDDTFDSSRSSDTSILTTGRDHSTSSQSRKARHNSVQTNNTDGRASSPGSRPRSPLPSSDVTPWLFQDFKVSARDDVCLCTTLSTHVCPTMYVSLAIERGQKALRYSEISIKATSIERFYGRRVWQTTTKAVYGW